MRDFFYGHRKYGYKQFNFADVPHIDSWAIEFLRRSCFGGKLFYGEKSLSLKKGRLEAGVSGVFYSATKS